MNLLNIAEIKACKRANGMIKKIPKNIKFNLQIMCQISEK